MPVKKVVKKSIVKIVPALGDSAKEVDYSSLKQGECFLYVGSLWMKENEDQAALDLRTGTFREDLCGSYVIPVDITINWQRRK